MDGCVGENARKISIGITGRVSSERVSCPN
jgi:hypothetical protein